MNKRPTGFDVNTLKKTFLDPWHEDLALPPAERRALLTVALLTLLFLILACYFSLDRGFHVDELATIHEGRDRVQNANYQAQHGLFLDLYHRYIEYTMGTGGPKLLLWRLPSILPAALGLLILGLIGVRHFGPFVGVLAPALLLCLPRFWVSAMEMRFYGIMFFLGVVALGGVLLTFRGRLLSGMLAVALSAYLCYRMQPAGLPFHGTAGLAGIGSTAWFGFLGVRGLLRWRREGGGIPVLSAWHGSIAGLCLAAAGALAVALFPRMMRLYRNVSERRGNLPHEYMPEGWEPMQALHHMLSWPGRSGAAWLDDPARYLLGLLLLGGAGALFLRRRRVLAACLFLLWLLPHALTFAASWHVQFSIKYLSSTLPLLGLLVALGAVGVRELLGRLRVPAPVAWAGSGLVLLPLLLTALATVPSSLADDPSNAHRIARQAVAAGSGDGEPILFAPTPTVIALQEMDRLGLGEAVSIHERQRVGFEAEAGLLARGRHYFRAEYTGANLSSIAGLDVDGPGIRVYPEYRSSFNPRFNLTLYEVVADPLLPAGVGGELVEGRPFALLGQGEWVVEAPEGAVVMIGKEDYTDGDLLRVEEPMAFSWSIEEAGGGAIALHPAWENGPIRRDPALASSGDVYQYNGPMGDRWRLLNNLTVGYTFDLPEDPAVIIVEASAEPPAGQSLLLRLDEEEGEIHANDARDPSAGVVEYHYAVPARHLGTTREFTITMLSENAVNREKDENTRALDILGLRIEPLPEDGAPAMETKAATARRAQTPDWPPPPDAAAGPPEAGEYVSLVGAGTNPVTVGVNSASLVFHLPPGCDTDALFVRPMSVRAGEVVILEMAFSTAHLQVSNIAPLAMFLNERGETIGQAPVSRRTVGRHSQGVTWRSGFLQVPANGAFVTPFLFLNLPPGQEGEEGAEIRMEDLRLWRVTR